MNLIAAVTNFFRPVPAVLLQDDHEFLLDDPTIVEIRQNIQVSDVQLAAMNRHSQAFLQNMHYKEAVRAAGRLEAAVAITGPAGTFPLPDDARLYHAPQMDEVKSALEIIREESVKAEPLYSHDIAFLVQRGEKVEKPVFDEDTPRIKVGEIDDHLASNTGAGSPRSQLMYQLNLIRDAVASAQNQSRDVGYELDPKILALYEDSFSAFVHEKMGNTITLICQLYKDDRNGLFETVENLGYTLWSPDKGRNLYLKILTRTAKIHLR